MKLDLLSLQLKRKVTRQLWVTPQMLTALSWTLPLFHLLQMLHHHKEKNLVKNCHSQQSCKLCFAGPCTPNITDITILTETHIGQEQIHQIRNNWLGLIFFTPGDTFSKGILILLHSGFDDVTDVDTVPKGRFVSFKVASSNDRLLCIYAPSVHSNREQLIRGHFFEGLQTYIENKTEGNENKIIIGDFKGNAMVFVAVGRNLYSSIIYGFLQSC